MESTQDKTLVIIVTYNGIKWLERCLDSVNNSSIPLDAYIVDNGSTDGSQKFITDNYPQFTFCQSPTNSGFGAANNIALKYAIEHNYNYVYLLNQDAWVDPDTISTLIKQQKLNPEYGVISPLQVNAEKTKLDKNFEICCSENDKLRIDTNNRYTKEIYEVPFVMAAHWLISRDCLHKVNLFSPIFYHYGEDMNYLHRVKYHGFKIGIVPSVQAVHDREFRNVIKKNDISRLKTLFLVQLSNINYPLVISLIRAYMSLLKSATLKSIKYKDISVLFVYIFRTYPIREVTKDRTKNK